MFGYRRRRTDFVFASNAMLEKSDDGFLDSSESHIYIEYYLLFSSSTSTICPCEVHSNRPFKRLKLLLLYKFSRCGRQKNTFHTNTHNSTLTMSLNVPEVPPFQIQQLISNVLSGPYLSVLLLRQNLNLGTGISQTTLLQGVQVRCAQAHGDCACSSSMDSLLKC